MNQIAILFIRRKFRMEQIEYKHPSMQKLVPVLSFILKMGKIYFQSWHS